MSDPSKTSPTAEQILEAGRKRRIKEVLYLGGTVYAWGFKAQEARAFHEACAEATGRDEVKDPYSNQRLVQHCLRTEIGDRIFKPEHLTQMADMNESDFRPLLTACMEVNGYGVAAEDEIRKNSGPTRDSGSGSVSQPTTE